MSREIRLILTCQRANLVCQTNCMEWLSQPRNSQRQQHSKTRSNSNLFCKRRVDLRRWKSRAWVWHTKILICPSPTFQCQCFKDLWPKSRQVRQIIPPLHSLKLEKVSLQQDSKQITKRQSIITPPKQMWPKRRHKALRKVPLWRRRIDRALQPWSTNMQRIPMKMTW